MLVFATQPGTHCAEFCWCRDVQINVTINIHEQSVFSGNY